MNKSQIIFNNLLFLKNSENILLLKKVIEIDHKEYFDKLFLS